MSQFLSFVVGSAVVVVGGACLAYLRWRATQLRQARAAELARDHKLDKVVRAFEGFEGDAFGERRPGLLEQLEEVRAAQESTRSTLHDVRTRQEEIAQVANGASAAVAAVAADVSAVRVELTRNGGKSTKDAAHQAQRSAEAAAAAAAVAAKHAASTEELLVRHMGNGVQIMDVGLHNDEVRDHNDSRTHSALRDHGIEVTGLRDDYLPYPPVDTGGPLPPEGATDD